MKQLPLPERPTRPEAPPQQGEVKRLPKRLFKRISYITVATAVILLIVWTFRPKPIRVDIDQIRQGELQVTVNAEGKTRVRDRFVIAADTDGRLVRITLNEGDAVTPGMTVAQIDPLPLNASVQQALARLAEWQAQRAGVATQRPKAETVEQARTRIRAAETRQQQAEAKISQARAALTQAQRDLERSQQLAATGAISQKSLEVAELNATTKSKELETAILAAQAETAAVDVAKAALAVVQQEQADPDYLLKVYDARIASTEAELAKLRDEATRTVIRAPVAGKVLRIHQKSAQFVTAGTPLLEVGNPAQLELVIDVLSSDAVQIKPGNPILIASASDPAASPASMPAKVRLVEPSAFTKTSALGVEEQRINVIGDFIGSTQPFGDAYRVDTRIVIWQGKMFSRLRSVLCFAVSNLPGVSLSLSMAEPISARLPLGIATTGKPK
jgi:HlyD family secretion protein